MKSWIKIIALSLVVIVLLACAESDFVYDNPQPVTPSSPAQEPQVVQPAGGDGYKLYFTNPPLSDGQEGIEVNLISLIDNAKVSVHGAVYEIDLANVVDSLVRAKARGLDVALVYDDDQMKDQDRQAYLSKLKNAGIPLVPDRRSAFMHDKFFIIDGVTVWTGSFNISENASRKNNENAAVFESTKLAENYEREFSEMQSGKFGPSSPADTPFPDLTIAGMPIYNYFAPEDGVEDKIISVVKGAENSVDFLSFSFTDVDLAYTMSELAIENDISVRGVFESRQMNYSVCPYLMLRNESIEGNGSIKVKLDGNPATMHEKVIIVDNSIVIFGSFNFSTNANESNDENVLIVLDPVLASKFEGEFQKVYDQGIVPLEGCKKP